MMAKTKKAKEVFLEKQQILENARKTLKKEFIGIDKVIDEIIDNVSSWFFLSDIQEKPIIINLWGLTGTGKTSLVNRLVELIDFESAYFRFDLGEKEGDLSFREALEDLCEYSNNLPVIIALDEIQHSRTIKGPFKQEIDNDKNRMIWELIDSGLIKYHEWNPYIWSIESLLVKLMKLLDAGVKVNKGLVVENIEMFRKEMEIEPNTAEKIFFVPENSHYKILNLLNGQLGLYLKQDDEKKLLSLSGDETIEFLHKVLKISKRPSIKNFTKSLIFVIGNLDEAYPMSSDLSIDLDADEFHKMSKRITVPQIKKSLQSRFRNEQVARLGNIHIIYPALDKNSYSTFASIIFFR